VFTVWCYRRFFTHIPRSQSIGSIVSVFLYETSRLHVNHGINGLLTQSETVDFAADKTTWRTWRNITPCLRLAHWLHYVTIWRHPQKRKYIMYIALSSEKNRATVTGNMRRKFGELWACRFWDKRTERQTNRHTNTVIAIPRPPTGCEVKKVRLQVWQLTRERKINYGDLLTQKLNSEPIFLFGEHLIYTGLSPSITVKRGLVW